MPAPAATARPTKKITEFPVAYLEQLAEVRQCCVVVLR